VVARLAWLVMTLVLGVGAAQAGTLERVRDAGAIKCGVSPEAPGFSVPDGAGEWAGLYPGFCRAVAAAVFADPAKVAFVPVSRGAGFAALRARKIDILADYTAWTLSSDVGQNVRFVGALYHEGHGLMVPRRLGVATALELSGADVCVAKDSSTAMHVADFFRRNAMPYELVTFAAQDEALQAYDAGRCDVYAGRLARLAMHRDGLSSPDEHIVLGDVVGVEPVGPVVRQGDPRWADIVRWTLFAMIGAEALQLTSDTIDDAAASPSPLVRRFAGLDGRLGKRLGLAPNWAANVVRLVGNYGELFNRTVGEDGPLGHERRLNRLWRDGGLLSAPFVR